MLDCEDASGEASLYVVWLVQRYDSCELAQQACDILRAGGYAVAPTLCAALADLPGVDLADFIAANFPFETDDPLWLDYCAALYPCAGHASLTAEQRNGARVSWRRFS